MAHSAPSTDVDLVVDHTLRAHPSFLEPNPSKSNEIQPGGRVRVGNRPVSTGKDVWRCAAMFFVVIGDADRFYWTFKGFHDQNV